MKTILFLSILALGAYRLVYTAVASGANHEHVSISELLHAAADTGR